MPRADAQRNYERILAVARDVVQEQGLQASLRDVARRAEVGLGTLYRHFPTREALLEALLGRGFDRLAERADTLAADYPPEEALAAWVREFGNTSGAFRGLPASLLATLADEASPLYASCKAMREAVTRLLHAAQRAGHIRPDIDGTDLFALVNAIGWITEQAPSLVERRERFHALVLDGLRVGGPATELPTGRQYTTARTSGQERT